MSNITTFAIFLFTIAVLSFAMIAPLWAFKLSGSITLTMLSAVPLALASGLAIEMLDEAI
jgi:hypothetical protein